MKKHSHTKNCIRVILLCPLSLLFLYLASVTPSFSEWYATNIYPVISKSINSLSAKVSFSVAEIVIIVFFSLLLIYLIYTVVKLISAEKRGQRLLNFVLNIASISSLICFVFVFLCGVNYHRYTFTEVSGLEVHDSSTNELYDLCADLTERVNLLRTELTENSDGVAFTDKTYEQLAVECQTAYDKLESQYSTLIAGYSVTKPVYFSSLMSYSGITGVFFPFTYEANVNVDVPLYTVPSTMCHELTHLRGYMREDEANYIAYLACKESEDSFVRYSGYMLALVHSMNRLYGDDTELYHDLYNKLSDDVKADLRFNSSYWASHEGVINEISDKVNDAYLKVNNQDDGVKSYGRMVDLLLAEFRKVVSAE